MSRFPDFILIGAGKCGTTSLHDYLDQHPQVYICPQKETFFFINEPARSYHKPWGAITDLEHYLSLFKDAPQDSVVGEISTNYYAYPQSAQLIYNCIPTVQIIAILRNPVDRAFSDYQMLVRAGHEKRDFSNLLSPDIKYIKRGFYYSQLMPFFRVFKKEQIKIFLYDDFCREPINLIQDFFRYIRVDDSFIPKMNQKGRVGGLPKNQALHALLNQPNLIRQSVASVLKPFMPLQVRQKIRSRLIDKNIQKVSLSPSSRSLLVQLYRNDILQLQDLIERDLSTWLQ